MPLYFAYGTNMDRGAMTQRCPRSRPLGRARLARHCLFFMACGAASVMRDPRACVHGVLWELAPSDVGALDRYEEVGRGLYRKIFAPVLREPTGSAHALIYVGAETSAGAPLADHFATILAASIDWELPRAHIAYLQQLSQAYNLSEPHHERGSRRPFRAGAARADQGFSQPGRGGGARPDDGGAP